MASSNRHWPSMFKSKPCNPHHQLQHDINSSLISTQRNHHTPAGGSDERSPEPKPRWNPKAEQIRILESIFNSGMVNPPRDEIRKIRLQLQEYGQVGDANVFYWFQNRKSRNKHKLRHLQNSKNQNQTIESQQNFIASPLSQITPPSSSSSSSEKSSPNEITHFTKGFPVGFPNVNDVVPNSPTASVNQTYFHSHNDPNLPTLEPFPFSSQNNGFFISDFSNGLVQPQQNVGPCTSLLLNEIMNYGNGASSKKDQDQDKAMRIMQQHSSQFGFCLTSTPTSNVVPSINTTAPPLSTAPSSIPQFQGETGAGRAKCMVFINDVVFEVPTGPFNVRQAFGDGAVLIHPSGNPVLTDDWGVTLQPLQHGAHYYLI